MVDVFILLRLAVAVVIAVVTVVLALTVPLGIVYLVELDARERGSNNAVWWALGSFMLPPVAIWY